MLKALRERAEAASKSHSTSVGMSLVSLLDTAASHILATITEIGKMVCIRKASQAELDDYNATTTSTLSSLSSSPVLPNTATSNGGLLPTLRAVEEVKPLHQKKASSGTGLDSRGTGVFGLAGSRFGDSRVMAAAAPTSPSSRLSGEETRRLVSEPSHLDMNFPPPIFDQLLSRSTGGGLLSDDSAIAEGSEDAWAKLTVRSSVV